MFHIKSIKKMYNSHKVNAWLYLKRAGHRAELFYYYKPRMDYIRKIYKEKDYVMLRMCLKEVKDKSLYYAKRNMGFAVNEELFNMLIDMLKFQGRHDYVDILLKKTTKDLFEPIEERKE